MGSENTKFAKVEFASGLQLFERGDYRRAIAHFEKALALANRTTLLGGEIQTWLVNAYAAVDRSQDAIALCEKLVLHPDLETRKQAKRLLYILKAPKLKARPEWLSQIPDLGGLDEKDRDMTPNLNRYAQTERQPRKPKAKSKPETEPIDLSQVNTQDNLFLWVALAAAALVIGGLIGWG
ncbi:hypothetical protein [Almyronema epifaneia]|uniref:Tetratricopeptide repeat protein n=1 Tax=Almyronema epifaneia S1 TaxID=2991925 RepID=A0ABW6IFX0_9CYAN